MLTANLSEDLFFCCISYCGCTVSVLKFEQKKINKVHIDYLSVSMKQREVISFANRGNLIHE